MTSKPSLDLASISDYVFDNSVRDDPLLRALREETAQDDMARMQISAEQGQLMALLVKLTGAKRIIEVGTFTGYSSLCMARALPEDGELICSHNFDLERKSNGVGWAQHTDYSKLKDIQMGVYTHPGNTQTIRK